MRNNNYSKFVGMLLISFVIMYAVMFLNVDSMDHIYISTTRFYMALLMVSPMAVLMLVMMKHMYKNGKYNLIIFLSSITIFVCSLMGLRKQIFISDEQYMRAMIPHHSSAVLTSKHANIQDPEVKKLSESIIQSQEREIKEMKHLLDRLDNK